MRRSDVPVLAAAGAAFLIWLARRLNVEMVLSPTEIETALIGLVPLLVWLFTRDWPNGRDGGG